MTHSLEMDWAPRCRVGDRNLEVLWVTFIKLQRLRNEAMIDFNLAATADAGDPELADAILAPIHAELCGLALRASKIEAKCQDDVEYKAVILDEFLPVGDCNIQIALAKSLVNDIKRSRRCVMPQESKPHELRLAVASSAPH